MKITLPRIVTPIQLAAYDQAYIGQVVQVWTNPPARKLQEAISLRTELKELIEQLANSEQEPTAEQEEKINKLFRQTVEWFTEIWSQGPEETRWTIQEVNTFIDQTQQADPALWAWITDKTVELINRHRLIVNKQKHQKR